MTVKGRRGGDERGQNPAEKEVISVLYSCSIFGNLTPPFLTDASSLTLSLSLSLSRSFFLCNTLSKQILQRFFFPGSRVPVLHIGSQNEFMFGKITNKSDGKSLNMDIESLDRTELQRSVRMYVHAVGSF